MNALPLVFIYAQTMGFINPEPKQTLVFVFCLAMYYIFTLAYKVTSK